VCRDWVRARNNTAAAEAMCETFTFSSAGTVAMSARMLAVARLHNLAVLPATDLTRGRCNETSDARHYPGLVPEQVRQLRMLI
jgi:hypothetical protein